MLKTLLMGGRMHALMGGLTADKADGKGGYR